MLNTANTQGIYLNVPMTDWVLLKELIRKFGWQAETREQLLDRFVKSRSKNPSLTEDEIMEEVNAVRYKKWKSSSTAISGFRFWSFLIGHQTILIQQILTDSRFDVYVCDELLEEIHGVSSRPKIRTRIGDEELDVFFRIIYAFCRMAKIERQAQSEIRDPKDLYLLSLAESIEADYIVSGDADLLDLRQHKQTKLLKLIEFRKFLEN